MVDLVCFEIWRLRSQFVGASVFFLENAESFLLSIKDELETLGNSLPEFLVKL